MIMRIMMRMVLSLKYLAMLDYEDNDEDRMNMRMRMKTLLMMKNLLNMNLEVD